MPSQQEASCVPVVQWPRTPPFHGGNTGSNPVGDAISQLAGICSKGLMFTIPAL